MGLDIVAYNKLERVPEEQYVGIGDDIDALYNLCWREGWTMLSESDYFKMQGMGLTYDVPLTAGGRMSFRAGSYGGYSTWRNMLAEAAGYDSADQVWAGEFSGPFVELINFSDCEGYIGPHVSAKLLADFLEYRDEVEKYVSEAYGDGHEFEYFMDRYDCWIGAFETASDNGVVVFC